MLSISFQCLQRPALVGTLLLTVPLSAALAQTPPDAGSLRQQIERDQAPPLPRKLTPESPAAPAAMQPVSGISITVKEFHLAGNTLLSNAQLMPLLAPWLGHALGFADLQAAAAAVANAYREAGWVVRAYLPEQDIKDGIVTIQIIEAVFGAIQLEGPESKRVASSRILPYFEAQQKHAEFLNSEALDRALLLADDLPGVIVSGSLQAGQAAHETDLILKLTDEALLTGEAALDNTGSRSTGANRLSANLNLNSAYGAGELSTLNAIHTDGSDYARLGFTLPVGAHGWRVGANTSQLNYRLITAEFSALDGQGSSRSTGLEASYPLIRSRLKNLYLALNVDHKTYQNESGGAVTTDYRVDALSLGLNGNLFDSLGGGGANAASLSLAGGHLNLGGSPNQAADASTTQTAGSFTKLRYTVSRQQVLTEALSVLATLSGQWANKNLDTSERFYLGGVNGVRAYPGNEGSGALGQLSTLELRYRLPRGMSLSGFYDWGRVTVNPNNDFSGAATLNQFALKGAGLALGWQTSSGLNLKVRWARRIGDNPNPTAAGNDQDGSRSYDRFWLTTSLPF